MRFSQRLSIVLNAVFLQFCRGISFIMPRTKFRSVRRSVTRGKRSRKPKESNGSDDGPLAKKLHQDVKASSSLTTSKTSSSNLKPTGYRFQDVSILQRVLLASAVCKACLKGSLHSFERPSGCDMARTLVLQCANNACRAFTELPTSYKLCSEGSNWKLEYTASLVSPPLINKDCMLQEKRHWRQRSSVARFVAGKERGAMKGMKSWRALPMNQGHLDCELLFEELFKNFLSLFLLVFPA